MLPIYQDALLTPDDVDICGYKIGQLTIAQSAALWSMSNPFVFSVKGDLAQFATALLVLRKKYPFKVTNWIKESLEIRQKIIELKEEEIEKGMTTLVDYFTYHNRSHPRAFSPGSSKTPIIPWHWAVIFSIRRYFRESDIDAWNMPLLKIMCYHSTICHNLGDDTLYNELDCEIREQGEKEELEKLELEKVGKTNGR